MFKEVSYWLDSRNIIVKVNDSWDANMDFKCWTERASSQYIIGKHLFEFICDDVTRMYVSTIIDSVRLIPRTIVKPYRCDSSSHKRHMKMIISPEDNELVCLSHILVREEPLPKPIFFKSIARQQHHAESKRKKQDRSSFLIRCSICNHLKNRKTGLWQDIEGSIGIDSANTNSLNVIYGVCPTCLGSLARTKHSKS